MSVLNYALSKSNIGNCNSISDVPPNSVFGKYYHCIRFIVKATRLAKKIRKWFAGDRSKNKQLEYRFTGKESRLFCHNFMSIVLSLKTDTDQNPHTFQLHVFAFTAINLRDSVSLFSRITISVELLFQAKRFRIFSRCVLTSSELLHYSCLVVLQHHGQLAMLFHYMQNSFAVQLVWV